MARRPESAGVKHEALEGDVGVNAILRDGLEEGARGCLTLRMLPMEPTLVDSSVFSSRHLVGTFLLTPKDIKTGSISAKF